MYKTHLAHDNDIFVCAQTKSVAVILLLWLVCSVDVVVAVAGLNWNTKPSERRTHRLREIHVLQQQFEYETECFDSTRTRLCDGISRG